MRGLLLVACAAAFQAPTRRTRSLVRPATCTPAEAQKVVALAKQAISRDAGVKDALGALDGAALSALIERGELLQFALEAVGAGCSPD